MPARKQRDRKIGRGASELKPPQNPEEFLALDNEPATKRMPEKLAAEAATRRVAIYAPGRSFDASAISKSREVPGAFELELPKEAGLTFPGRKAGRMEVAQVKRGIKSSVDGAPFRPAWVEYTPHPKVTTISRPLLSMIDGRKVVPQDVYGSDDRQVYYPSGYPWTCVGKLLVWNDFSQPNPAWSGSGVLIGGRVVLTAGHVAPWGSNNWAMQFVPASYDGGSVLGRGVSSWVSDYWGYNTSNSVSAWDMVVLRLYTPLGNTYGYFGARTYSDSWEGGNYWTLAGYPGAVAGGNRPSRQMWFPTIDDDSSGDALEIEYLADSSGGNSGGPVFGFWNGEPYAIGTHSGNQEESFLWWTVEDNNVAAGGNAMVNLVRWARSNWP